MFYLLLLKLAEANFPSEHAVGKVWVFSQRPAQTNHVYIAVSDGFAHAMGISPTTSGPNDGSGLYTPMS